MAHDVNSDVAKVLGPLASMQSIAASMGVAQTWIDNFKAKEPQHYEAAKAKGSAMWEENYYDRARIYYYWSLATQGLESSDWRRKADEMALNYRDNYAPNGDVSAHWNMATGVALHSLLNDDARSKDWLAAVGVTMSAPYYMNGIDGSNDELDSRIQGRCLETFALNLLLNPDKKGYDGASWEDLLRDSLTKILSFQNDEGYYPWPSQGGTSKPFMTGILNDAMLLYWRVFEQDDRIMPAVKKACEYMWANDWIAADKAFKYDGTGSEGTGGAPDLNNLIINGFTASGMTTQANEIFKGSLSAWIDGSKQFNQTYAVVTQSLAQRPGAVSVWEGDAPIDPPVEPPIEPVDPPVEPPLPQPGDNAVAKAEIAKAQSEIAAAQLHLIDAHAAQVRAQSALDAALSSLG